MVDQTQIETEINSTLAKAANIPEADLVNVPNVPPLLTTLATDYAHKLVVILSTWGLATGIETVSTKLGQPNTIGTVEEAISQIAVSTAVIAISCAWTLIIGYLRKEKMNTLLDFIPTGK